MKKALLYLFVFLAIQFAVQFLVAAVVVVITGDVDSAYSITATLSTLVLYSVATIVVFFWARWADFSPAYVRSRPWGVLVWSAIAALGAIVPSLCLQSLLPEWSGWAREIAEQTEREMARLMMNPGGYLVIALLPPVVEEMVFRGAVLRSLLQWKPNRCWLMIVISAAFFALFHMNPAQMPHAFLIGLLLGWMYARTGSIVPGVVYHWANNSAAYAIFHIYHNPQSLTDVVGPDVQHVLLALVFSLCILLPALYQLNRGMKKSQPTGQYGAES